MKAMGIAMKRFAQGVRGHVAVFAVLVVCRGVTGIHYTRDEYTSPPQHLT